MLKNNEVVASQDIEADENGEWKYSFTNLPTFENGVECVYTVEEEIPDGYTATIENDNVNEFIITNTHIPEKEEPKEDKKEEEKEDTKKEIKEEQKEEQKVEQVKEEKKENVTSFSIKTGDFIIGYASILVITITALVIVCIYCKNKE